MIIHDITVSNFAAYAGEHALFPTWRSNDTGPITLIGGMNGYGKTSLLEAVLLALYGRRSPIVFERKQEYGDYLRDLIHRGSQSSSKSCVGLTISVPDGEQDVCLQIRRSWSKGIPSHPESLIVIRDGVVDEHLATEWDTYVEDIVPFGIAGLFFFDGERISELAQSDETTDSLRQAIRTLLGIETVDRLISDLGTIIRRNQPRMKDKRIRAELETLQRDATEATAIFDRAQQRRAELRNAIQRAAALRASFEQKMAATGGSLRGERVQLEAKRETLIEDLAQTRAEIGLLVSGPLPLLFLGKELQGLHDSVQQEDETRSARAALPLVQAFIDETLNRLREVASEPSLVATIEKHSQTQVEQLMLVAGQTSVFPMSPQGSVQLSNLVSGGICDLRAQAEELRQRHQRLTSELERIERYLQVDLSQLDDANTAHELDAARKRLSELHQDEERLEREIDQHGRAREAIEGEIARLGSRVADIEEADRVVRHAARSQETLRLFRERVTLAKITNFEREITKAFNRLAHKESLVSGIRVDPDDLHITLFDTSDNDVPKSRLSSGERQMLAVAILWGLGRASGFTIPVIIDTPLGRLDSTHRRAFVTEYLPNASHQTIVLSTDTEIVGDYLQCLDGEVGRTYRLQFDAERNETRIVDGYFPVGDVQR